MLRRLSSESTDFNFALAKYATSRRISCFGSADETISYMNKKHQHRGSGLNLLKPALRDMVLKQFDKRPGSRKTDTAKVRFTFVYFRFWSKCVINKFKLSVFYQFFFLLQNCYKEVRGKLGLPLYCFKNRNTL